jgi:hypothetical protein
MASESNWNMNGKIGVVSLVVAWASAAGSTISNDWMQVTSFIISVVAGILAIRSYLIQYRLHQLTSSQVVMTICKTCKDMHNPSDLCPLPKNIRSRFCPNAKAKQLAAKCHHR